MKANGRAWEPLTPRGVAAFAGAGLGRLLLLQLLAASLAAGAVIWFLETAWFPVIRSAIHQLPEHGELRGGELEWPGPTPERLAANRFLGLSVDLFHSGRIGREAQLQVEFGKSDARVWSLLGYAVLDYPPETRVPFNRLELEPWLGGWEPVLVTLAALATVVTLMLSWAVLATLYFVPVRLIGFFQNRDLNWSGSWKLSGAALLPGALFLTVGIFAHSLGLLDLIRLGGIFGLHFVVGWIYLFVSPIFLERHAAVPVQTNPFARPPDAGGGGEAA